MRTLTNPQHTINASYLGYITQAIINNFMPLLFLTFRNDMGISLAQITLLTSLNFVIQLVVDLISPPIVNQIGSRVSMMIAHFSCTLGFISLAFLPFILSNAYTGILISLFFCSVGGGLIEVMVSPIVESCPGEQKEKAMSMLHSFYCWGYLTVILVSTLFFKIAGIQNWRYLALIWSLVPLFNTFYFSIVPLFPIVDEDVTELTNQQLLSKSTFWILVILMICAGASEMGMSQWASSFMESGLNISKTAGDLAGPASFALFMGISRAYYGKRGEKIALMRFIEISAVLCILCYALAGFSPSMLLAALSCAVCGFSIGIFWPGTFSIAAKQLPAGGVRMYSYLALAGDVGCSLGTACVGIFASLFAGDLRAGLGMMMIFPAILLITVIYIQRKKTI